MAKCLLTELQAVVNGNDFDKFQTLRGRITIPPSGTYCEAILANGASVIVTNLASNTSRTWIGNGQRKYYAPPTEWGNAGDIVNVEFYKKNDFIGLVNSGHIGVDLPSLYGSRVTTSSIDGANSKSWGNIEDLDKLLDLISISVNGCEDVVGDIRQLARKMVERGRTSGRLSFYALGSGITLDGTPITSNQRVTFDSSLSEGYSISSF